MVRPTNTTDRRAQIVEGLLTVMSRVGYERATVQAIGAAAGLAPGLVHYHFDTKQEVLVALVATLVARVEDRYAALRGATDDPRARLDAFIDAHVALGPDADVRSVAAWNLVGAEAVRIPGVRALYRQAISRSLLEMRRLVRASLVRERRSTRAAGPIAAALVSAIEGAYRIGSAAPRALPRGYAAPMIRRAAAGLIAAQPRTP